MKHSVDVVSLEKVFSFFVVWAEILAPALDHDCHNYRSTPVVNQAAQERRIRCSLWGTTFVVPSSERDCVYRGCDPQHNEVWSVFEFRPVGHTWIIEQNELCARRPINSMQCCRECHRVKISGATDSCYHELRSNLKHCFNRVFLKVACARKQVASKQRTTATFALLTQHRWAIP